MKRVGFTLVELLIVMGVLAVVVVTILVTLNPSEAGKKSRDLKRMKDLATLEAIILQYIQDGNPPLCTPISCDSNAAGANVNSQSCDATNIWIRSNGQNGTAINLCNYTKTVPVDPLNTRVGAHVYGGTASQPVMCDPSSNCNQLRYLLQMVGGDYRISVMQESKSNAGNVLNDGGTYSEFAERSSDMNLW